MAVAAAAVAVGAIAFLIPKLTTPGGESAPTSPGSEVVIADLRPYAPVRGTLAEPEPLELAARSMRLRLLLPAGSELGQYGLVLVATGGQTKWSARSQAEIIDHTTALSLDADLSQLRPGQYTLWIAKDGVRLLRVPVVIGPNRKD